MNNPLVSIIIPCYKQSLFLNDAVESVLKQTFNHFEIIIIGSDEDSNKIGNELVQTDSRIQYHYQEPLGLANARNYGFQKSKGDFIQFLDADDFIRADKFEKQIKQFKKNPELQISISDHEYYYTKDNVYRHFNFIKIGAYLDVNDILFKWNQGLSLPIHACLFKRSIWDNSTSPYEYKGWHEDWYFWYQISEKKIKIECIEETLAIYRVHENNFTKNNVQSEINFIKTLFFISTKIPDNIKDSFINHNLSFALNRFGNSQINNYKSQLLTTRLKKKLHPLKKLLGKLFI